jgi:hypothetical protein
MNIMRKFLGGTGGGGGQPPDSGGGAAGGPEPPYRVPQRVPAPRSRSPHRRLSGREQQLADPLHPAPVLPGRQPLCGPRRPEPGLHRPNTDG